MFVTVKKAVHSSSWSLIKKLWEDVWKVTVELYDSDTSSKLKKIPEYRASLLDKLAKYVKSHSKLLVEVPSCLDTYSAINEAMATGPYYIPQQRQFTLTTAETITNEIKVLCANTIAILQEGFQLLQSKATEILAFIACDVDRQFSVQLPCHMSMAYALKGSSLNIETLWELLTRLRMKCKETVTKILCEFFDGQ